MQLVSLQQAYIKCYTLTLNRFMFTDTTFDYQMSAFFYCTLETTDTACHRNAVFKAQFQTLYYSALHLPVALVTTWRKISHPWCTKSTVWVLSAHVVLIWKHINDTYLLWISISTEYTKPTESFLTCLGDDKRTEWFIMYRNVTLIPPLF